MKYESNWVRRLQPANRWFMTIATSLARRFGTGLAALSLFAFVPTNFAAVPASPDKPAASFAGSQSCRECHPRFYALWSSSLHGLALQPYTATFARSNLTAQAQPVQIGAYRYRADLAETAGSVVEQGPEGERRYGIEHALGGKNVYYFLTPLEGGKLQTLPVAYDVRKREWFDTALSGMRHFPGQTAADNPIHWKEWPYTFNTACYGCHVSQLNKNYDLAHDTYQTSWKEAGINCETCHGPSDAHNRAMLALPAGKTPSDYKLIRTTQFTPVQHNESCVSCHAKGSPLTAGYRPPERFFDHFDLVTFESPDYYPDGRDLGENYTQTSWLLNPCARKSKLNCVTCHTSSGRYRFQKASDADQACLPCHQDKVQKRDAHTHHKASGTGSQCIACHMPMTEFARMRRTDHSMLPPTPSATIQFNSPNACNLCHADKDAVWADRFVREWHRQDYQAPILKRASLIAAARKRDWTKLPEMLAYVTSPAREELFAASLVRLMRTVPDRRPLPALLKAVNDASPLVRGAACETLGGYAVSEALQALASAAGDETRLVRVRAAAALSEYPQLSLSGPGADAVKKATEEYLDSLLVRPDSWDAHYNLGNYYLSHRDPAQALSEYAIALKKEPQGVQTLVNSSIAYARLGQIEPAETALQAALRIETNSAAALFNLGLLKAEQNDLAAAEKNLRAALKYDPQLAAAAYNLGVLLGDKKPEEALSWCKKAADVRPDEPKYAYTLAFFQRQQGDPGGAQLTLQTLIERQPTFGDAYFLLADLFETTKRPGAAARLYRKLLGIEGMPTSVRQAAQARLDLLNEAK